MIGGTNPSILEVNYALHVKKHELHGDSQNAGLLQKAARLGTGVFSKSVMYVVGFFVAGWAVTELNRIAWPWVYLVFPPVFFTLTASVWFGARKYPRRYLDGCVRIMDWILSIVIGGLVGGLAGLIQGLYPFYQNPYVLMLWGLYFLLITDIVYLQDRMDKLVKQIFSQSKYF